MLDGAKRFEKWMRKKSRVMRIYAVISGAHVSLVFAFRADDIVEVRRIAARNAGLPIDENAEVRVIEPTHELINRHAYDAESDIPKRGRFAIYLGTR